MANELTWEDEQDIAQYRIWKIDNDWATAKGYALMPQTIVKETTVYTLAELDENFSWSVHEKALSNVKEYEWEGWEPSWYTEDITMFIENEFKLFELTQSTLEWGTNPNFVRAKGDIDLREYMKAQKLHIKYRSLWHALTVHGLESSFQVSFGYGDSTDLHDLERGIDCDIDGLKYDSPRYLKLIGQVRQLEGDIDNYLDGIESRLLGNLRAEIDWRWSDEFAKEEAEAHELVFTEDGELYHG